MSVPVRIPLEHKDSLARHGYRDVKHLSEAARRRALRAAAREFGATYVIRKLNVLAIYNRNRHPRLAALFKKDMRYVQGLREEGGPRDKRPPRDARRPKKNS